MGLREPAFPFEREWQRGETDYQRAPFARNLRHGRRGARTSPPAKTSANENHPGIRQCLAHFIRRFIGGVVADLGIAPRPQTARHRAPELHLARRDRAGERLHIGVDRDEIGFVEAVEDNAIENIAARAADADDFDGDVFVRPFGQIVVTIKLDHRRCRAFL
jgi:hypothetical protein